METIFSKKEKGFTMLETIIAVFILAVGIIGSYFAFVDIASMTTVVSSRLTAAYLGQEGVEIIRNIRDTNWLTGSDWDTGLDICEYGCEVDYRAKTVDDDGNAFFPYIGEGNYLKIDSDGFYTYNNVATNPSKFKRKIAIILQDIDGSEDILNVSVLVTWKDLGQSYSFTVEENLYNWK